MLRCTSPPQRPPLFLQRNKVHFKSPRLTCVTLKQTVANPHTHNTTYKHILQCTSSPQAHTDDAEVSDDKPTHPFKHDAPPSHQSRANRISSGRSAPQGALRPLATKHLPSVSSHMSASHLNAARRQDASRPLATHRI